MADEGGEGSFGRRRGRDIAFRTGLGAVTPQPLAEPVEHQIDHRRGEDGEQLADSNSPKSAMPSGRRSSAPAPVPIISGTAANKAASVVIRIGRKRSTADWKIAFSEGSTSSRSAEIAK